ncbi:glycoside hydrolase family 18 protein [Dactylosporangium sp. CS-033363]|uniref:glycoside hydrolase family 18 protein n=1 Tax=Dactylosporangium sp. CS-033363 TaxID=3239935 RepID=UPI003D8BAC74
MVVLGAYFPASSADAYPIANIPAGELTHLFYAFGTIEQGHLTLPRDAPAHLEALAGLKRAHPRLRTVLSIGGWGAGGFSDAALTKQSRAAFVDETLALLKDFDGVDLDWEFPVSGGPAEVVHRPEDRRNATLLAQDLRARLGDGKILTAALPAARLQSAGAYDPAESFEIAELAKVLDFVNLMTYDFGTGFSPIATFNAPLEGITTAVDDYLRAGVARERLVLGVPFYGRGFLVDEAGERAGLGRPQVGTMEAPEYRDIVNSFLPDPAWERHRDPVARSPWLYHAGKRAFVSYEDALSIEERAAFAAQRGLAGVFTWQLAADDDRHSLLGAMTRPFAGDL